MGSVDRSKKRIQLWKKALIHFSLCFVMGFFTGFAPGHNTSSSIFSGQLISYRRPLQDLHASPHPSETFDDISELPNLNRSLMTEDHPPESPTTPTTATIEEDPESNAPTKLLIIVTTTTTSFDPFQKIFLRRLSQTLKLVAPPLLWIVVEAHSEAPKTEEMLRKTGIMYRHLTFKDNFTDSRAEVDHQRNVALNHIEHHKLNGIVHFATLSNIYDLQFFEEIREIEVFGTWPVAKVSASRKRVLVEGPVCSSSEVVGWQMKDVSRSSMLSFRVSNSNAKKVNDGGVEAANKPPPRGINLSSFAFNSSILWDPERWGRASAFPDVSQDSIKFVQEVVLEDETKLKAIPLDCSKIMLWSMHITRSLTFLHNQNKRLRK